MVGATIQPSYTIKNEEAEAFLGCLWIKTAGTC
jgi:hypothetical protein